MQRITSIIRAGMFIPGDADRGIVCMEYEERTCVKAGIRRTAGFVNKNMPGRRAGTLRGCSGKE